MMSVFAIVITICTGSEGCLEERQPAAYSTRDECMESVATMPVRKGMKYHCSSVPPIIVKDQRRATQTHLVTTSDEATAKP